MFVFPYEIVKEQKNSLARRAFWRVGPERGRTADLLNANQALYQLSYRPERGHLLIRQKTRRIAYGENGGPKRNCTSDPSVISTVLY